LGSGNKLVAVGVIAFMLFAAGMAFYGYQQAIYPVDSSIGYLSRAETAQTPEDLAGYVVKAKRELPETGNPVWSFPTARTDFSLIQGELDRILSRANSISSLEIYSTEYNTGMTDMHASLRALQEDLTDALPYMYASFTNIIISSVMIAVVLLVIAVMRRGKSRYQHDYQNQ
jgi:hypothetical protein